MGSRGKTPSEGRRGTHWSTDRVPEGSKNDGYVAGDLHIVQCHQKRGSKPCRKCLLGSAAECEGCERHQTVTPLGYQPLYRSDGKPVVVCVQEYSFESVESLPLHARVAWGRREGDGEGVWIQRLMSGPAWYSTLAERNAPADLTEHLLRIWKMSDLRAALTEHFAVQCQPAVTVQPADDGVNDPFTDVPPELARRAAEGKAGRLGRAPYPPGLVDVLPLTPERNGHHKPK